MTGAQSDRQTDRQSGAASQIPHRRRSRLPPRSELTEGKRKRKRRSCSPEECDKELHQIHEVTVLREGDLRKGERGQHRERERESESALIREILKARGQHYTLDTTLWIWQKAQKWSSCIQRDHILFIYTYIWNCIFVFGLPTCAFKCKDQSAYISAGSQGSKYAASPRASAASWYPQLLHHNYWAVPSQSAYLSCRLHACQSADGPAAGPLRRPLPTACVKKKKWRKKSTIPAHVGRNIHYVIIARAIALTTSCLNQGCQG